MSFVRTTQYRQGVLGVSLMYLITKWKKNSFLILETIDVLWLRVLGGGWGVRELGASGLCLQPGFGVCLVVVRRVGCEKRPQQSVEKNGGRTRGRKVRWRTRGYVVVILERGMHVSRDVDAVGVRCGVFLFEVGERVRGGVWFGEHFFLVLFGLWFCMRGMWYWSMGVCVVVRAVLHQS